MRPRQNARHFADDIFELFLCELYLDFIFIDIFPNGPINKSVLVQIMAWRREYDKSL